MNDTPLNLPELVRLSGLLREPTTQAVAPSARQAASSPVKEIRRPAPQRPSLPGNQPFGQQTLRGFFGLVNWHNDPAYVPLAHRDSSGRLRRLRGELALASFFRLGNWSNAAEAPAWPTEEDTEAIAPVLSVEVSTRSVASVMSEFAWDE
jgi:hypothetical protein